MDAYLASVIPVYERFDDDERQYFLLSLVNVRPPTNIGKFVKELFLLTKRDFIGQLPAELVDHLLAYFDYKTALTACRVSKSWLTRIAGNSRLWKRFSTKEGIGTLNNLKPCNGESDAQIANCLQSEQLNDMAMDSSENSSVNPSARSDIGPSNDECSPCLTEVTYRSMFVQRMRLFSLFRHNQLTECITLEGHTGRVTCIYYHNGIIATGSDDHTVRLWDTSASVTDRSCRELINTWNSVSALKFDDKYLVTGSFNASVSLWDIRFGARRIRNLVGHIEAVFCVDMCVDLDLLLSGSASSSVAVWSLSSGEMLRFINVGCKPRSIDCLRVTNPGGQFSADQYAVVVGNENRVTILTIPVIDADNVDTFDWRKSESNVLRVCRVNEHQCIVTDVVTGVMAHVGRCGMFPRVVHELIEIEKKTSSGGVDDEMLPPENYSVCGKIVNECAIVFQGGDHLLLGAGSAFALCLDRIANKLSVVKQTGYGWDVCKLQLPQNVQWLIGRGPVATLCDNRWLDGLGEHVIHQTLAAVALTGNQIAVFRMRPTAFPPHT